MKDELTDVLFAIEREIWKYDRNSPLDDETVREALDALVREYTVLWRGRVYTPRPLSGDASALAEKLRAVVESQMDEGRSLREVLESLKIVRASVKRHAERRNPRAYLDFIRGVF